MNRQVNDVTGDGTSFPAAAESSALAAAVTLTPGFYLDRMLRSASLHALLRPRGRAKKTKGHPGTGRVDARQEMDRGRNADGTAAAGPFTAAADAVPAE